MWFSSTQYSSVDAKDIIRSAIWAVHFIISNEAVDVMSANKFYLCNSISIMRDCDEGNSV